MNSSVEELIQKYHLEKHPEGGYFYRTYCAKETIETDYGIRPASTAIIFLLTDQSPSHMHRLKSDEMWHFYEGDNLSVVEINKETGNTFETILGNNLLPQYMVKRGNWFGSYIPKSNKGYCLVGCTVTPGFDYKDFELGDKNKLLKEYGKDDKSKELISKLTY